MTSLTNLPPYAIVFCLAGAILIILMLLGGFDDD